MARTTVVKSAQKDQGTCENCGAEIRRGDGYKWIAPRLPGSRSSHKRKRCEKCPGWQVWDYSQSLSARVAKIQFDASEALASTTIESQDDARSILEEAATEIEALAEEKRESAQSIEDGFQHPTSQSEELTEQADSLESWAQEVRDADIPDLPEPEEDECSECGGSGEVDGEERDENGEAVQVQCDECDGTGQVTPDNPTDEQMDEWRSDVEQAIDDALSNSPV